MYPKLFILSPDFYGAIGCQYLTLVYEGVYSRLEPFLMQPES